MSILDSALQAPKPSQMIISNPTQMAQATLNDWLIGAKAWPIVVKKILQLPIADKIALMAYPTLAAMVFYTGRQIREAVLAPLWNFVDTPWKRQFEKEMKKRQQMFMEPRVEFEEQKWLDKPVKGAKEPPPAKCFFAAKVGKRIQEFASSIPARAKAGLPLLNAIFYGPPGVGKTLVCKEIARRAGVNYMILSGAKLREFVAAGAGVDELHRIFGKIAKAKQPTILFIDEVEVLFRDRRALSGQPEAQDAIDQVLSVTGEFQNKCVLILALNHYSEFDEAMKNRMHYKFHIDLPAYTERLDMLKEFVSQAFNAPEDLALFEDKYEEIAKATEGFPGRTLRAFLETVKNKQLCDANQKLYPTMIDEALEEAVTQYRESEQEVQKPQIDLEKLLSVCQPT